MPCCGSCCKRIGGLSLILLSNASSTALYSLVKILKHVTAGHLASFVAFFSICALVPAVCFRGDFIFQCKRKALVLFKCVTECLSFIMKFWCLKSMHLGDATVVFSTSYLFSAIFGRIFLKEKLTVVQVLTSIFGVTGVIMINKPVFLFSDYLHLTFADSSGTGIATASALLTGLSVCAERSLSRRDNSYNSYNTHISDVQIIFYEQILLFPIGWVFDVIIGDPPTLPGCGMARGYFVLCSFLVIMSIIAMKKGIEKEQCGVLIRSFDVILAYIVQILFFGQRSDFVSILGAATIVICTTAVATNDVIRKARGKVVIPVPPPVIQPKPKPAVQCPEWEFLRDFEKTFIAESTVLEEVTVHETSRDIKNDTTEDVETEDVETEEIETEEIETEDIKNDTTGEAKAEDVEKEDEIREMPEIKVEDGEVKGTKHGDTDDEVNDVEEPAVAGINVEKSEAGDIPVHKEELKNFSEIESDPLEESLEDSSLDDSITSV